MVNGLKVSIITATFNSQSNISECIHSVAGQSYSDIEHIIVDGTSTDNTVDIIKRSSSVTVWISEPDSGIYDALNKGIKMATGDIIGFLHSDDLFYEHDRIKKIVEIFKSDKTISGVYGNLVFVDAHNTEKTLRSWLSNPFQRKKINYGWMPPHPTLFLKKEVYHKHGLFDTSFRIAGDYDFMLRVMKDKDIRLEYLPEYITRMRLGGVSTGSLKSILRKSNEDIRALRNNGFKFPLLVLISKNLRKLPQIFIR